MPTGCWVLFSYKMAGYAIPYKNQRLNLTERKCSKLSERYSMLLAVSLNDYIPLIANQFLPHGRHVPTLYADHHEIFPSHHEKRR